MKPSHPAWAPLRVVAKPLISDGATTLSTKEGVYANLYDNVWMPIDGDLPVAARGIFEFPAALGWMHDAAQRITFPTMLREHRLKLDSAAEPGP